MDHPSAECWVVCTAALSLNLYRTTAASTCSRFSTLCNNPPAYEPSCTVSTRRFPL